MEVFKTAAQKLKAIAGVLEARGYETLFFDEDEELILQYTKRVVWEVFAMQPDGILHFVSSWSSNTEKSKEGLLHGLDVSMRLSDLIGDELYYAKIAEKRTSKK